MSSRCSLHGHQRYCDDAPEQEDEPELDGLEAEAFERDDGVCVRCGAEDDLIVHSIDPEGPDRLQYLATLCQDCENELEGLHPRTKRTKIAE